VSRQSRTVRRVATSHPLNAGQSRERRDAFDLLGLERSGAPQLPDAREHPVERPEDEHGSLHPFGSPAGRPLEIAQHSVEPLAEVGEHVIAGAAPPMARVERRRRTADQDRTRNERLQVTLRGEQASPVFEVMGAPSSQTTEWPGNPQRTGELPHALAVTLPVVPSRGEREAHRRRPEGRRRPRRRPAARLSEKLPPAPVPPNLGCR
jgi:hypothetical protein